MKADLDIERFRDRARVLEDAVERRAARVNRAYAAIARAEDELAKAKEALGFATNQLKKHLGGTDPALR